MSELLELGKNACDAKYVLQKLTTEEKNKALQTAANDLCERQEEILAANVLDLENGKNNGMNPGLLDRLKLTGERIAQIAEGLRQIAVLPDCIGETMEHFERPNGLKIDKVRVPLGVIGIIYEARPNVTADAFGLCFKTGNAVILKGGSDAIHSNIAIVKVLQDALEACSMPRTAVQLIEDTDRAVTAQFMEGPIIFFGDMCGEENTSRPANVRAVRLRRTASALQSGRKSLCQKVILFDRLSKPPR